MTRIYILLLTIFLISCSGEDDVRTYVENIKKGKGGNVAALPPPQDIEPEKYTALRLPSPFGEEVAREAIVEGIGEGTPLLEGVGQDDIAGIERSMSKQQPRPDSKREKEFLERYPIENFTMVGILSKKETTWGLLQDTSGIVHAVQVGNYIGKDSGKIVTISNDKINVVETVADGKGGWVEIKTSIKLQTAKSKTNNQAIQDATIPDTRPEAR